MPRNRMIDRNRTIPTALTMLNNFECKSITYSTIRNVQIVLSYEENSIKSTSYITSTLWVLQGPEINRF